MVLPRNPLPHPSAVRAYSEFAWTGLPAVLTIWTGLLLLILFLTGRLAAAQWSGALCSSAAALLGLYGFALRNNRRARLALSRLDTLLLEPIPEPPAAAVGTLCEPWFKTAVLIVDGYHGLGVHSVYSIQKLFQDHFRNFLFVSSSLPEPDSGTQPPAPVRDLEKYAELARSLGYCSDYRWSSGTRPQDRLEALCDEIAAQFSDPVFFAGELAFARGHWLTRLVVQNDALNLQRRLLFKGRTMMMVPIRVS